MEKRKELFDPESRFILLRPSAEASPIAFTIFRFDTEGIAEEDMEEVVYWSVIPSFYEQGFY